MLSKEALFFFVRTNTGFDLTQLTRVVAWPSPTLLLLARSGSQRCSFEHLQVVVPHTFVAKVASTPLGPCILYSSPPAREHCTGLPADHAYCTAVCQRVCHVQDSSRVSSISLRIWAEPEAATQREQGQGGDLQRVSIVQDLTPHTTKGTPRLFSTASVRVAAAAAIAFAGRPGAPGRKFFVWSKAATNRYMRQGRYQ